MLHMENFTDYVTTMKQMLNDGFLHFPFSSVPSPGVDISSGKYWKDLKICFYCGIVALL